VQRASDNAARDIGAVSTGGSADSTAQDSFCSGTTCLITVIYDQSGRGNNFTQAPPGGFSGPGNGGYDNLAISTAAPITLGGRRVYGLAVTPGTGYRNDSTNGVATGDQPEGMYAVLDGTRYNSDCCFDYGNAETNSRDNGNGNGTMEAIYFGNSSSWGSGSGNGPWTMADLENGLFSGASAGNNGNDPSISYRFTTAIIKGEPNHWAIRGGNAQSGGLSTFHNGSRPGVSGYNPMKKEGAIILGMGGDNSHSSAGTFYEGALTSGYPSDATENAVQANLSAAGYGTSGSSEGGGLVTVGSSISLRATTSCCATRYLTHSGSSVVTSVIDSSSSATDKGNASWAVRTGLADRACVSFESRNTSGSYLRHQNFQLYLQPDDGTQLFASDATFCPQLGRNGQGNSFESYNYPDRFFRHDNNTLYLAANGGSNAFDATTLWSDDISWVVTSAWRS